MDGSHSSDDKAFQAAGPDVENARGLNVDVSVSIAQNYVRLKNTITCCKRAALKMFIKNVYKC